MNVSVTGRATGWTQPLAFGSARSATSGTQIFKIIKESTKAVVQASLIPTTLITDEGGPNLTGTAQLEEETKRLRKLKIFDFEEEEGTLHVKGQELVHVWNVPHLSKCSRNLLSVLDLDPNYVQGKKKTESALISWGLEITST
ncbi:hypothetical protein QAD02_004206 [Eretmocerus hayati]|uniref:Uncharacterized protein n=1 Tax=Eretmocerus hayati TaxID=131215 RepID=A0ACC2NTT4_9HYME|nr:hypothetical protein QAD02_004206 [Eretmocerus hayati]